MTDNEPAHMLSRWARRKAEQRAGRTQPQDGAEQQNAGAVTPPGQARSEQGGENRHADTEIADPQLTDGQDADESEEERQLSDAQLCARYELPDPQNCTQAAELDDFFSRRVPDRLRQLALRRLWRLNPLFRFADQMVEYGEDYTDAATVIPDMQTAYKVGKGYLDNILNNKEEETEAEDNMDTGRAADARQEAGTNAAPGPQQPANSKTHDQQSARKMKGSDADKPESESDRGGKRKARQPSANSPQDKTGEPDLKTSLPDENSLAVNLSENETDDVKALRPRRMVFERK